MHSRPGLRFPFSWKHFLDLFAFGCAGLLLLCRLLSSFRGGGLLSSCGVQSSVAGASLVEHRLQQWRLPVLLSTGSVVVGHRLCCSRMSDLPGPGIKLASLILAGRFFTTEPLGKPSPPLLGIAPFLVPDWLLYQKPLPGFFFFFFSAPGETFAASCVLPIAKGPSVGTRTYGVLNGASETTLLGKRL